MSNTNDPKAPYGEKREPLLSVEKLVDEFCEVHPLHAQLYAKQTACWVRDFYENLIDKGELRVVKKVELWHPLVPEEAWRKWLTGSDAEFSMLVTKCCSRNPWCPPWGLGKGTWEDKEHEVKWPRILYVCPGCGGEIQK
jgi:hypothetical protein